MRHTTANMKKANSSAVASADDQRAKTNFDVHFYRCWLVSRPLTLTKPRSTDCYACSVCLCSVIRLIVLSRLKDINLTCKLSRCYIKNFWKAMKPNEHRELRECWNLDYH